MGRWQGWIKGRNRAWRRQVATGVGVTLVATGVLGVATGTVTIPGASAPRSAQAVSPTTATVNVFDMAAAADNTWTVPDDGVQIIEVVEFVGSGGFGGDSSFDNGSGWVKRTGGQPCRVHSSAAVTAGKSYKAFIGERGGDGSLDIVDPGTNNSRRPGGVGGRGYQTSYGTYGPSGGNGGDSYITLRPHRATWQIAGGAGGGGSTAIVQLPNYPIPLQAAGGGGASPTISVTQVQACDRGAQPPFAGLDGLSSGGSFDGGGSPGTTGGTGGTEVVNGRYCLPPSTTITGQARASAGSNGTAPNGKGIGGAGGMGLLFLCGFAYGTAGGGGGGGGFAGGGGGASYNDNGGGGPGGTGSSMASSNALALFKYATTASVGGEAYVRWATIDTTVLAAGVAGTPYSTTLTATFGDPSVPFPMTAAWNWTATGLPTGWTLNATTGVLSGPLPATPVTVKVTAAYLNVNLTIAKTSRMYTVGGASGVSVTAKAASSAYGADVASVGYDTLGLAADDWFVSMNCGAFEDAAGTTPVTSSTKPGAYYSVCSGPVTSGLGTPITYTNGVYTVSKAPLSITAKSFTKTYGDVLTLDGTSDFTVSGLIGSDAVDSVTLTTSGDVATAAVSGSPYSIVPSAAVGAASQVLADWYAISYANGAITVNKAAALLVDGLTGILNEAATDVLSTLFSASGFLGTESFSSTGNTAPTCKILDSGGTEQTVNLANPIAPQLSVGTYTVRCSGGSAPNYDGINYGDGKLVIKLPDGQVTAQNAKSAYGSAPAAVGFDQVDVPSADAASVTCAAYESYTNSTTYELVTSSTEPGTYITKCTGPITTSDTPTRDINYDDGVYTVTKVPLTITAKSHTKTYGDVLTLDGTADFTVAGLVNSDTVDSVTLTTTGDVGTAGVAGSPYAVVPSAALMDCECDIEDFYDITYVDGTITVGRKTLTVRADDVSLETGASVPTSYGFTATGWENGEDDTTNLPDGWVAPTCESSFNSTTPPGTPVDIVCSGGSADDYEFSFTKGTATIGDAEIGVENTTDHYFQTSTYTAPVTLSASLVGGGTWAAGCLVTFTLDPSKEAGGPYFAYPSADQVTNGTPVTVDVVLPVGAYDVEISLSGNCSADGEIEDGFVVVTPNGPTGNAHVDTYGTRYLDVNTGTTVTLNMEWLRKRVRTKNPSTGLYEYTWVNQSYYNWSVYGANQWRIAVKPFSGTVTLTDGDPTSPQTATVSTWGRMDCPEGMYPAGNASICSAVTNIVMLQEWVPRPSNPKYGTWRNVGEVLIVEKLAEGRWPYRCATVACKTPLPDYVSFQLRPVPGSATPTVIPTGFPAYTDWTRVTYGSVDHK